MFGSDGTLLATLGDGASYNLVDAGSSSDTYWQQALTDGIIRPAENVGAFRSQLLNCYNGKLLRMDPNTGDGVPSNPWYDASVPRAPKSRVWAMGLRNPYRATFKPNSGSTDPAAGNPGVIYIGDVQWGTWEDLNVCTEGGMNFGWPMFEGLTPHSGYMSTLTPNLDVPNPLYDGVNCTTQYLRFRSVEAGHTDPPERACEPMQCQRRSPTRSRSTSIAGPWSIGCTATNRVAVASTEARRPPSTSMQPIHRCRAHVSVVIAPSVDLGSAASTCLQAIRAAHSTAIMPVVGSGASCSMRRTSR
ncbi:MAG: PQQ-dependent sugar dehydrogenase [Flavobacteriales bacterium]|nr:PQQ-dependent sugar dehydrogenase [Flavobacteriales bacterium]